MDVITGWALTAYFCSSVKSSSSCHISIFSGTQRKASGAVFGVVAAVLCPAAVGEVDPPSGRRIDIKALAEKVSEKCDVSIGELRSGGRRRAVVKARYAMSWIGVRELGYSGADVARYLGVTNSCVTRMISTGKEQGVDDINIKL
jgi:hypothetical protein